MNWDDVLRACIAALRADTQLRGLLGGDYEKRIKRNSSGAVMIPSVTYQVITTPLEENTESMTVQWDVWAGRSSSANEYANALTIEERLRDVMNFDLTVTIGNIRLWSRLVDSRDHADPEEKVAHRSLDFLYTFAKQES